MSGGRLGRGLGRDLDRHLDRDLGSLRRDRPGGLSGLGLAHGHRTGVDARLGLRLGVGGVGPGRRAVEAEVERVLKLVQARGPYRLGGPDRLRIEAQFPGVKDRVAAIRAAFAELG